MNSTYYCTPRNCPTDATCLAGNTFETTECSCNNPGYEYDSVLNSCELTDVCAAKDCEAAYATCIAGSDLASTTCTCDDYSYEYDAENHSCEPKDSQLVEASLQTETIQIEIPAIEEGVSYLLRWIFDNSYTNYQNSQNRRRKRRDTIQYNNTRVFELDPMLNEIMSHGCHCIKLDGSVRADTGLGSRNVVDPMDKLCKMWRRNRRCLTLIDGSCENRDLSEISYHVEINQTTKEMDCSVNDVLGADQCQKDLCYIDVENAEFILAESQSDPFWTAVPGDQSLCPSCDVCVPPVACTGVAPNVDVIDWLAYNSNSGN